jgi:hypothetical protein
LLKLIRVISGQVTITNNFTDIQVDQNFDYLTLFFSPKCNHFDKISTYLLNEIDHELLNSILIKPGFKLKNQDFYNRLLSEISNFVIYQERKSYTTAYVFIYRILELISFSFPLIYASKTSDFKHTYSLLKDFYDNNTGNQKGELGFFKSALGIIFKSNDITSTSVNILFDDLETEIQEKFYHSIFSVIDQSILHEDNDPPSKIAISFLDTSSFIITIRNRFFHLFNRGEKNLESNDILDSDLFFSYLSVPLFSWIVYVLNEILRYSIEMEIKNAG